MRKINLIIIHCSATRANRNFTVEDLEACHKARGFKTTGYHYYITKDGESMLELLKSLCLDYPEAEVIGHRDLPWVRKSCPGFDVKKWLSQVNFHI